VAGEPALVVVISDRLWREHFGAARDVLGQTVRVEGTPLTIVGVLPPSYRGLNADEAPDLAVPLALPWRLRLQPPLAMHAVGRLREGIAFGEAVAHLTTIWPEVQQGSAPANRVQQATHLRVVPLASGFSILRERYRGLLFALVALAACLLLLACVNIGGLSLARLLDRRAAFAVQLALGAGRKRLAAQLLFEGFLIAAMAALIAIPLAWWSAHMAGQSLWTGYRPFTIATTPLATTLLATTLIAWVVAVLVAAPGLIALFSQHWISAHRAQAARSGAAAIAYCLPRRSRCVLCSPLAPPCSRVTCTRLVSCRLATSRPAYYGLASTAPAGLPPCRPSVTPTRCSRRSQRSLASKVSRFLRVSASRIRPISPMAFP
jgi:MacB-like periplasmic core domain/FtsX-like permease family